jgi:hypothetical protein
VLSILHTIREQADLHLSFACHACHFIGLKYS